MSQLRKVIERAQRGEGPRLGFGASTHVKPRALAIGMIALDADGARQAVEAGADFVLFRAQDTASAVEAIKGSSDTKAPLGAWLSNVGADDAQQLTEAGVDFVASSLEGTRADALDSDQVGHVLAVTADIDDTTLRTLGALGLEGMFVKRPEGEMTLQNQVEFARLSVLSGLELFVSTSADVSTGELRVLRDSGAVAVIATEDSSAEALHGLNERLRTIPPRRAGSRGNDTPLLPTMARNSEEEEHEHDE